MSIYVFSLLSGFTLGGMDYAQGARNKYLKKLSQPIKYIYTNIPTNYSLCQYAQTGIHPEDVISAHFYLSGNGEIGANEITEYEHYSKGQLIAKEYYSNRLLYTDYFISNATTKNQLIRRRFLHTNGSVAYDIVFDKNGQEKYIYPSGRCLTKQEFLCEFIKKLNLSENDIILIDRGGHSEFAQPLFTYANMAKIVVFLHAGHYAEKGEASEYLYFNYEYYYWLNQTKKIHTILVSTELQKKDLIQKLKENNCHIPTVKVIPANGVEQLFYSSEERKPYSLVTASRLDQRKKIDWIIRSVIIAHEHLPQLTLDIYGTGSENEVTKLKRLVQEHNAESYIHFMGHCNMHKRYLNYEAYISASLGETLGLTLMEAAGSGNALLGLDVKYGNKIFIQNNINGYTSDFDFTQINNPEYINKLIQSMADNIVRLFNNSIVLRKYQENSYQIASLFLNEKIEKQWIDFIQNLLQS